MAVRESGDGAMSSTSILVTDDSPRVERSKSLVESGGFLSRLGFGRERSSRGTFYHPYYFQSWKVTVPKTLGRILRVRLCTGVNAVTLSVGPASGLPGYAESEVSAATMIESRAATDEAARLALEYMKTLVGRRYRPARPPTIEREACELLYVPYYAYTGEGTLPGKEVLVEGLTGSRGRVEDVPAIHETFEGCRTPAGDGKGG